MENSNYAVLPPIQSVVLEIVKLLVDDHDNLAATAIEHGDETTIVLRVAPVDLGKVIGKQGRTARSLRVVLHAAGLKLGRRFALDIQAAEPSS